MEQTAANNLWAWQAQERILQAATELLEERCKS
jgi:hypothetical protein